MIQQHLIYQVNALVIQGVAFELPLKFLWRDRESQKQQDEGLVAIARTMRWIYDNLQARN